MAFGYNRTTEFSPLIYVFKNLYPEETRAALTDVKLSANEIAPYSMEEIEGVALVSSFGAAAGRSLHSERRGVGPSTMHAASPEFQVEEMESPLLFSAPPPRCPLTTWHRVSAPARKHGR